mgnify:CR=1 FL=1
MKTLQEIKSHLRSYSSNVDTSNRDKFGEVFTPTDLVNQILDNIDQEVFVKEDKTFLDHCCGNGQILSEVLIRKLSNGIDFEIALQTIYGVEINEANVLACRERLLCGREELRHIVEKNIVCADGLEYDYLFGEPEVFGNNLFQIG